MMFTKLPGGFTQVFEIPLPALARYLSLLRQLRYTRFMQTFLLFSLIEDLLVIDPSLLLSPAFFSLLFYLNTRFCSRAVKFVIQIASVWLQMGQIWDFLRSVSVHFGLASQNILKRILKVPDLSHLGPN